METPELPKNLTPEEIERQKQNLEQEPTKETHVEKDTSVRLSEINEDITKKETNVADTQNKIDAVRNELKLPPSTEIPPSIKTSQDAIQKLKQESKDIHKKNLRNEIVTLASIIEKTQEVFPFPGVDPEVYGRLKESEQEFVELGYVTSVDDVITRIQLKGMKISLGKNPDKGEVFILPAEDAEVSSDSLFLHQLQTAGIVGTPLGELMKKVKEHQSMN